MFNPEEWDIFFKIFRENTLRTKGREPTLKELFEEQVKVKFQKEKNNKI